MKIRLTRNVGIRGEAHRAGEVVEVTDTTANILIRMGKAEPVKETATVAPGPEKAVQPRPEPRDGRPAYPDEPVTVIKGIGPATAEYLAPYGIETVADLAAAAGLPEDLADLRQRAEEYLGLEQD